MHNERDPKHNEPLTLDEVTKHAKETLVVQGTHLPTIIVEGKQQTIAVGFDVLASTHLERVGQLFFGGVAAAQTGEAGELQQVFFICQGWLSLSEDGKLRHLQPSQEPKRVDALLISHMRFPSSRIRTAIVQLIRGNSGRVRELKDYEIPESEQTQIDNPLLLAFIAGYQFGHSGPVNLTDME